MQRRAVITALIVLAAAPAHAADPAPPKTKTAEVGKIFPYLDRYLKLSAAERDRWTLAYYLRRDGKPAEGLAVWIDEGGGRRTTLPIGAAGRVERLPTLEQIAAKRQVGFDAPATSKFGMSLEIEPMLRPASELSAPELAAAVQQATRGAKKAAGMMRLVVPSFDGVRFLGAQGGEAVLADGRAVPLPVVKGAPVFRPAEQPTARLVRFRTPPTRMVMG